MKARGLIALVIVTLGVGAVYWYAQRSDVSTLDGTTSTSNGTERATTTTYTSKHGDTITIETPRSGDRISNPLVVEGIVPGSWSFEASFPVEIVDADHNRVAEGYGTVEGEWMTSDPVEFTATVKFKPPVTDGGFVVIHKANASGDERTQDSVEVPITFGPS